MLDCVLAHRSPSACDVPAGKAFYATPPSAYAEQAMTAAHLAGKVPVIDMSSLICPGSACVPVIGNVLVFWDRHHLTREYAGTLAPFLQARLLAASPVLRAADG